MVSILFSLSELNAQTWNWANSAGGTGNDGGAFVINNNNGDIFTSITGYKPQFYIGNDTFNINGFTDFFLTRYNSNGTLIWTRQFGGPNNGSIIYKYEVIHGIAYDSISNSVYLTGIYVQSRSH